MCVSQVCKCVCVQWWGIRMYICTFNGSGLLKHFSVQLNWNAEWDGPHSIYMYIRTCSSNNATSHGTHSHTHTPTHTQCTTLEPCVEVRMKLKHKLHSPRPEYTYIRTYACTYLLVPRSAGWSQAGMHLASGGGGDAAGPRQGTL